MKLECNLDNNDYLQHQLYKASKRRSVKIQRIRSRIISSGILFLLGIYAYILFKNVFYIIVLGIISLIYFLIHPLYFRQLYRRHYSKFIKENYNINPEKKGFLEIYDNFILMKEEESASELKVDIKEIKEIVEIQTNYFIIVTDVSSIILPKNIETNEFINILINKYNVKINRELDWKWK
jgi:hypothetical protein